MLLFTITVIVQQTTHPVLLPGAVDLEFRQAHRHSLSIVFHDVQTSLGSLNLGVSHLEASSLTHLREGELKTGLPEGSLHVAWDPSQHGTWWSQDRFL